MARPKRKTEATTLKMTPEVRDLWERCAAEEHRSLTNMFEVMVREHAKRLELTSTIELKSVQATDVGTGRGARAPVESSEKKKLTKRGVE